MQHLQPLVLSVGRLLPGSTAPRAVASHQTVTLTHRSRHVALAATLILQAVLHHHPHARQERTFTWTVPWTVGGLAPLAPFSVS